MKLNCSRKDLVDAIGFVLPVAAVRSPQPLFQTIRFVAEGGNLTLTACNGEIWAERTILANIETAGSVCIQGKTVQELINALPDGPVYMELADHQVTVRAGASDWKLMCFEGTDFPSIPSIDSSAKVTLTHKELSEAIDAVAYAVAEDNARPALTGVLCRYNGHELSMVATDTHRLAVVRLIKEGIGSEISVVIPERALRLAKALPVESSTAIELEFDESRLKIEVEHSKIVAQLVGGAFPDWERVVPEKHTRTWTLHRSELIDHLNRVQILARDSANRVRFGGNNDMVVISARSEEKGEAKEEIPAIMDNGEIEIAFNGQYVLEAVRAIGGDAVIAQMTESSRAAVFRAEGDEADNRFCVIMPMALS